MSSDEKPKKPGRKPEVLKIGSDPGEALDRLLGKVPRYAVTYFIRGGEYLNEPIAAAETIEAAKGAAEKWWRDNECGENIGDGEELVLVDYGGGGIGRTLATFIGARWSA